MQSWIYSKRQFLHKRNTLTKTTFFTVLSSVIRGAIMHEEERILMVKYGITCSMEAVYHFKTHTYKNLIDALNYAKIEANRDRVNSQIKCNNIIKNSPQISPFEK
ncbi:hypothetical protein TDB9533_00764 [Thalassocella blandensis]|nr:hypothetical protein TDB9533_00764 [Thalassocella blandensis]